MDLPNQDIFYPLPMKHFHCFVEIMEIKQMNAMKRYNKHQKIPAFYHEWPKYQKTYIPLGKKNGNQKLNLSDCLQPQLQMQAMSKFFHQNTHYARWSIDHAFKKMVFVHQDEQ